MYIYIYIYTHVYTYIYIYMYIDTKLSVPYEQAKKQKLVPQFARAEWKNWLQGSHTVRGRPLPRAGLRSSLRSM